MPEDLKIERVHGAQITPHLADLARLRITVFRDWPYLYAGSEAYEAKYLQRYVDCHESAVALVFDGDQVVGASTAMPLDQELEEFRKPFRRKGMDPGEIFYLGESVLLPAYRGRGLGHAFFDQREAAARELGRFTTTAFCAVDRAADDPRRPADYRVLDGFWTKRGYVRQPGLTAMLGWQEIGEASETEKPLTFWLRPLD
jgi:GNAT superfamily N-acetyltransferase